jgi:CxxC motif-containing protein (DUF1111 family)
VPRRALFVGIAVAVVLLLLIVYRPQERTVDLYAATPGESLPGLNSDELQVFQQGKAIFEDRLDPERGLGPLFNAQSCYECHGQPGAAGTASSDLSKSTVIRVGTLSAKSPLNGDWKAARENSDIGDFYVPAEMEFGVLRRHSITTDFANHYSADCKFPAEVAPAEKHFSSRRQAPPLLGMGLIQSIDDQTILTNMVNQAKAAPYLAGRINAITDKLTNRTHVGKFGYKAQQPDLLLMTAEEMYAQLGLSNSVYDSRSITMPNCLREQIPPEPNDSGAALVSVNDFQMLLAPPPKMKLSAEANRGQKLFVKLQCAICHSPELSSAPYVEMPSPRSRFPSLRHMPVELLQNQPVALYSDLLLHPMGPQLADGIVQGTARGGEWRTTPLWGLRYRKNYLHDGRATSLDEAIKAHGGQAEPVTRRYLALSPAERDELLKFLQSL